MADLPKGIWQRIKRSCRSVLFEFCKHRKGGQHNWTALDYLTIGLKTKEDGNLMKAIYYFNEAVSVNPWDEFNYIALGQSYKEMGDYEKALIYIKKAVSLNPWSAEAHIDLGLLYNKIGDYEKSIKEFEYVVHLDQKLALEHKIKDMLELARAKIQDKQSVKG